LDKYLHPNFTTSPWKKGDFTKGGTLDTDYIFFLQRESNDKDTGIALMAFDDTDLEEWTKYMWGSSL
jgi:hypothetical protein